MMIDVVSWVKDGAWVLPKTLKQLENVLPSECVHRKIMVDDYSNDETREIGKDFNWEVYTNPHSGISSGANFALSKVDCPYFMSLEQDLFLSDDWWNKIPRLLDTPNVMVASGIRLPNKPVALRKLEDYIMTQYQKMGNSESLFLYGKTLDNTIYKTELLRKIGGFPKLAISPGVDNVLAIKVNEHGLKWIVDFDVKSSHLRNGLIEELKHYYWYGICNHELNKYLGEFGAKNSKILLYTLISPVAGIKIAFKKKCWQIIPTYTSIRLSIFLGILRSHLICT